VDKILLPLSMLGIGEEAILADIRGGHKLKQHLAAMGMSPGMKVVMLQNNSGGPVVLGILDSRIALGRGMAQKIMVSKY